MKKIIIILIILILLGVGAYLLMGRSYQPPTSQVPVSQNKPTSSGTQTIQGTIKSLLSAGKSQKCTYSSNLESGSVGGVVYIANGKMRGDFVSVTEQTKINGHMIVDSGFSYIWTDMNKQGIKMAIDQKVQPTGTSANSQTPDINQTFNYTCQTWTEDNSMFTLPSDISFSTFTLPVVQPSGVAPSNNGTSTSVCSACDNLPAGSARDTCKAQLGCE